MTWEIVAGDVRDSFGVDTDDLWYLWGRLEIVVETAGGEGGGGSLRTFRRSSSAGGMVECHEVKHSCKFTLP